MHNPFIHQKMHFNVLWFSVSSTPFPTETVCSSNAITDSNNVTDSNIVTQDPTTDAPSANTSNSSQTLNIPTRVQVHSPTLTNTSSEPSTTVDNAATTNAHASVTASIVAPNLSAPNDSVSLTDPSESSVKFTEPPVTQTGDTVKHSVAQTGTPATSLSTMHVTTDKPETTIPVPHSAATTESNEEATEHTTIGTTAYIRASTVSSAAQTDASIVETTTTTTAAAAAAAEAAAAAAGQIIDSSNPTGKQADTCSLRNSKQINFHLIFFFFFFFFFCNIFPNFVQNIDCGLTFVVLLSRNSGYPGKPAVNPEQVLRLSRKNCFRLLYRY